MIRQLKNKNNEEIKCNRCVESVDCYACKQGGKPNCPCFSPKGDYKNNTLNQ